MGWLGIFDCIDFIVWLCFPNLLCYARKFGKGVVLFDNIELAQCRLMGFTQIVTGVTSVGFTFFVLHCAFDFFILFFVYLFCFIR